MASGYSINLRAFYDAVKIKEQPLEDVITRANCLIFELIGNILYGSNDINIDIVENIFKLFCVSVKSAAEVNTLNVDDVFNYIAETSQELLQEMSDRGQPMRELCYILGTSSESNVNYSLTSRVTILVAILSFFEIKFDL